MRHSKEEDKLTGSKRTDKVKENEQSVEGSYYYDDSSNYEVYRDDDDDADDDFVSQRSAERRA